MGTRRGQGAGISRCRLANGREKNGQKEGKEGNEPADRGKLRFHFSKVETPDQHAEPREKSHTEPSARVLARIDLVQQGYLGNNSEAKQQE